MTDDLGLPLAKAPDPIWSAIESVLDAGARPPWGGRSRPRRTTWFGALAAAAVGVAIFVSAIFVWRSATTLQPAWDVVRLAGKPSISSKPMAAVAKIGVGQWLQTDASSRARISVGNIGAVEIAPNTRVQVEAARPDQQRLKLARGEISASVSAPPRLFFVDTPASRAVDLGCAYTMDADAEGNGLLRVTLGWVSLEWEGRESLVPAGASCRTRPKIGPGTPYFDDAPPRLQTALADFDFSGGDSAIDVVLRQARVRDTLTLWHLLSRVDPAARERVYDRIVDLVPLPKGIEKDKALQLDPKTLELWREELAWKW
jgi:hypothetical protein